MRRRPVGEISRYAVGPIGFCLPASSVVANAFGRFAIVVERISTFRKTKGFHQIGKRLFSDSFGAFSRNRRRRMHVKSELYLFEKKNIDLTISVHTNIQVLLLGNEWNETRVEIVLDHEWRMSVIWKLIWLSMADERQNGFRVKRVQRFLVGFENIQKHFYFPPPPHRIRSMVVACRSDDRFRVLAVRN